MKSWTKALMTAAAVTAISAPAMAVDPVRKIDTERSVSVEETNILKPDGTPAYEQKKVVTRTPVKPGATTFYYYDPEIGQIVTGSELTDRMIQLWDTDKNRVVDNREFYTNALIVYETREYVHRTYQDIDGQMKMTKEDYTLRLQQLPAYRNMNKDGGEGLTLWEFTGVGFQDADHNNNNQVSYNELRNAFWAREGLIPKPLKLNH